jgi:predicted RNA-binding protein YlxR (DUF448 family)
MRRGTTHRRPEQRHRPIRTCIGCGRKSPKNELLRFVASDGTVVFDPKAPGRAAYTCRRLSCFERAASRNAFSRTLRRRVRIEPNLVQLLHLSTDHG